MNKPLYNEVYLDEYIDLIIRMGINIQRGQQLVINCSVECAFFARAAMKAAFDAGASNVFVRWNDDICSRTKYLYADDAVFDNYPKWDKLMMDTLSNEGAAVLSVSASDPEAFKGVKSDRLSRYNIAASAALKDYYEKAMSNKIRWCVASVPSEAWALKVFPDAGGADEAISLLWEKIFEASRVGGGNAVDLWDSHIGNLRRRAASLNDFCFKSLHFSNSLGTDLYVGLPEGHIWSGGGDTAKDGFAFLPNIPTEEIFTAPLCTDVNGTVAGTIPNVFRGNLIDGFSITFKDGKAVSFDAETGREHLDNMINDTPGMDHLGEVALVEHNSPISNTGILFYNTLFDENASCHLAFGNAYPYTIKDGAGMDEYERGKAGLNISDDHHDFMFGSADMTVTGITATGDEIIIINNGQFVL